MPILIQVQTNHGIVYVWTTYHLFATLQSEN